jgi:glycosyltransferase involved in cell wall biosynthesis
MRERLGRFLVVSQHYWPEEFRVTDLCDGLVENGYEVDVLCGIPNYPGGKFFKGYGFFKNRRQRRNGVNIFRVPEIPRGNNTNPRILINFLSFPFFSLFYLPRLFLRRYDWILAYQLSPVFMSIPGIVLAKLKGVKLYFYICDFWPHSLFSILHFTNETVIKLMTAMSYWHYRQADGLMGAFKGIQTRLVDLVGIDRQRTLYIPQGAEKLHESEIFDAELAARFRGRFNLVFTGSVNPAQSFDTVLAAVEAVLGQGYDGLNVVVVGDGMSKQWLVEQVEARGLTGHFSFEGFHPVEEVPKYSTLADAMLVALSRSPLFEYGIPAKLLSYMAAGKPIVGAIDGEGKRLINDSGSGVCVDSGDAQGLAKSITRIMDMTAAERKEMGAKGREYHLRHFERNHNLRRLIEFVVNDNRIVDSEYSD